MQHFIFPLLWTLIIGVLTGLPGNTFPDMSLWALLSFDSFAHCFVFAIFTFLWSIALCKQVNRPVLRRYGEWIATLTGIAYGALVEMMQYLVFVGRSAEWNDILADALGCLFGLAAFRIIYGGVKRKPAALK